MAMAAFMSVWLSIWTAGVVGLLVVVFSQWRAALGFHSSTVAGIGNTGTALFFTLFAIPFVLGELFGLSILLSVTSVTLVFFLLTAGAIHVIFFHLLKAPTFAGRRLMDQVEGFTGLEWRRRWRWQFRRWWRRRRRRRLVESRGSSHLVAIL
jgi:hypothetical protein